MKEDILNIVTEHCKGWKNCEQLTEKLLNLFSDNNYLKNESKEEKKRKLLEDLKRSSKL